MNMQFTGSGGIIGSIIAFLGESLKGLPSGLLLLLIVSTIVLCYITAWQLKSCKKQEYQLSQENKKLVCSLDKANKKLEVLSGELVVSRKVVDTIVEKFKVDAPERPT